MRHLQTVLRGLAPLFILPGLLHAGLGLGAERLLDPTLPASLLSLASLDSQNRFYGVAFTLHGVLLWTCAGDLQRHATVLRRVLAVFWLAGLARLPSLLLVGWPAPAVLALAVVELLLPPLLLLALARALR